MATGTVKFFRDDKGWGFIIPDEGPREVFFHSGSLLQKNRWPAGDDRVEFAIGTGRDGRVAARDVRILLD
jgi:CspA family cold shock protein